MYNKDSIAQYLLIVLTMVSGTAVIMWLGELITDRGIGNGMSILIFTQVVATFPGALWLIKQQKGWTTFIIVMMVGLVVVAGVIFIEQAQRRIPVQYAKRMVGRRMFGGSSTYIPLKVNQAGIIPVIFASSLMYLPALFAQFQPESPVWPAGSTTYLVQGRPPALHGAVLRDDHLLHVLLRRDHVQPRRSRRQHEEVRRLHPGHPGRPADAGLPRVRAQPHHAPGLALPRPSSR